MNELLDSLKKYADSDHLPMHMPGHKRRMGEMKNPFFIDITEIDGFDDLHHAQDLLKRVQKKAADLYHAEETHYLINGSTAGILSAVSGCTSFGGRLLMARNCHKSVYHGALLRGLSVSYLYPQSTGEWGINGEILPEDVDRALKQEPDIEAVLITSPTYDGVVSDVRKIAKIAHSYRVPLLVDAAHGAHFPFAECFPEDAIEAGADLVIHSLHKTLPSLTQTALLHLNGRLIEREKVRNYLRIYQTSSPSYVLMASIDQCIEWTAEHLDAFERFCERLEGLRERLHGLHRLRLIEIPGMDISKVLVSVQGLSISGQQLAQMLRSKYRIEVEMACSSYICAITTVADRQEELDRLSSALMKIDQELGQKQLTKECPLHRMDTVQRARSICTFLEAEAIEQEHCLVTEATGRISADFVMLYPPGIPLLAPGEEISEEMIKRIHQYQKDQLELQGISNDSLKVLKGRDHGKDILSDGKKFLRKGFHI